MGSLYQHQLHAPLALRADGRVGLDLWHTSVLAWAGAQNSQSPMLPMGGGDKAILSRSVSDILVNTAHLAKSLKLADEKPRLMEITGRGFHKKKVPSWAAALRDNNTTSSQVDVTGAPHRSGIEDSPAGFPSSILGPSISWPHRLHLITRHSTLSWMRTGVNCHWPSAAAMARNQYALGGRCHALNLQSQLPKRKPRLGESGALY